MGKVLFCKTLSDTERVVCDKASKNVMFEETRYVLVSI